MVFPCEGWDWMGRGGEIGVGGEMTVTGASPTPFTSSESGCLPFTSATSDPTDDCSVEVSSTEGSTEPQVYEGAGDDTTCDEENGDPCDWCTDDMLSARSLCPRSGVLMGVVETSEFRRSLSLRPSTAARISA